MTKIKMLNDRIIFDGHADTRQECETITLMCDNLAKSKDFKTVRYESGYAEFEKVGKTNELKFASEPQICTLIFDSHVTKVEVENEYDETFTWTTSGQSFEINGNSYTTYYFTVTLEEGYEIASVVVDMTYVYEILTFSGNVITAKTYYSGIGSGFTITTKAAATKQIIDVSTLSGWANLSSGNHQITVKTKASGYADSAASNAVTVAKAATPHSVSATSVSDMVAKTSYYFSVDNGETWTAITAAGQIVASTTQIKFKVTIGNIPIGATAQITSTQLGLNLKTYNSVAGGSGEAISSNYTLTQDITDIVCESSEYDA